MEALIIIDMVNGFIADAHNPEKIIKNQIRLAKEFHKKGKKVILVKGKDREKPNSVMDKLWGKELETPKSKEIIPELQSIDYDIIIEKPEYDVFYKTDFEKYCHKNNIDKLYFTGIFTGVCVFFSSEGAAIRDILPILITDATAGPKRHLVRNDWQRDTLKRYKLMIGPLMSTDKVIDSL